MVGLSYHHLPTLGMRGGPTFGAADADPRPRRSRRRDQKQAGAAVQFRPARGSLSGGEVTRRPRRPGPHQYPDQREWYLGKRWKLLAKSDGEFARNSDIDPGSVALRTSRYASFLLVARSDLSYAGRTLSREPPAAVHAF